MFDIDGFSDAQNEYLDYELSNANDGDTYAIKCPYCKQRYINVERSVGVIRYICNNESCKKEFIIDWNDL